MNKVAIGRVVLTNREHIIALEPFDKGLRCCAIHTKCGVRTNIFRTQIQDVKVTKDMLDLAKHIVNSEGR